jgi:hypothetical protein
LSLIGGCLLGVILDPEYGTVHPSETVLKLIGCLTTLSATTVYSIDDKVINECGAIDGMRIGKGD